MVTLIRTRTAMPWDRPSAGDWADVLATFPLFTGVRKRQLRKLVHEASFAEFAPGERVLESEVNTDALYIILGGAAKELERPAARALRTGDYFGELAVLDAAARSATVIATTYLQVMKVPRQTLVRLAKQHAPVSMTMLRNLSTQLRRLETRVAHAG